MQITPPWPLSTAPQRARCLHISDSPTDPDYDRILRDWLTPHGLSELQVQAEWIKAANANPTSSLPNDNADDANIFKATFGSSFGSLTFAQVAQTGLSEEFLLGDLTVVGSLAGGGDLGEVDLVYVPEPSTLLLVSLGVLGALLAPRRRR